MATVTITEALAELKTIDKRLEKKRQAVLDYLYRQDLIKDPLEKDGGSKRFVEGERQAIADLEDRKVAIRRAIAKQNEAVLVTVPAMNGKSVQKTIAEWLTFRKEVAPARQKFLAQVRQKLDQVRREAQQKGAQVVATGEATKPTDIVVNLSEKAIADEAEQLEGVLGALDGQLSLKNATVTVEV